MNLVLKARVLAARDQFGVVGENPNQRLDPWALALGEIAEHVMLDQILGAGMTDADAHSPIIVADNADLIARGEDASFQNKVHLAMEAKGFGEAVPIKDE